ncbi:MAG: hypothetical protein U9P14_02065 [Gemmatimonadota bacterium]|nr:hypothetical protein [Gemmatimonadota bacterium]
MQAQYTELVISGTFAMVKGFLLGYRCGTGEEFGCFFHRKSGIRRDTLAEMLRDVLELDNLVHLCLEQKAAAGFKRALEKVEPLVGMQIKQERLIREAKFNFSFVINNRQAASEVKEVLSGLPESVELVDYDESESKDERAVVGGYAPRHSYTFKGQGTLEGEFEGVMELYLRVKRMPGSELMLMGDIVLGFGEE